jgi:hypothetical protein
MVLANSLNAPIQASEVEWTEEIVVFGRYLVDTEPPTKAVELYLAAQQHHFREPLGRQDRSVLQFALRHPWALGSLEAACALLNPSALLRRKLLLAAAILEVSPECADRFLPEFSRAYVLPFRLAWLLLRAGLKLAVGVPLLALARRSAC